jgi:hypothetical protein
MVVAFRRYEDRQPEVRGKTPFLRPASSELAGDGRLHRRCPVLRQRPVAGQRTQQHVEHRREEDAERRHVE